MNKEEFEHFKSECMNTNFRFEEFRVSDIEWLIQEVERLRTIEQAYNALRSAL